MEKKIIFTLLFGTALLLTAGCGQKPPEPTVPLVKYETVRLGADAEGSTYAAAVRGRYETVLAFQVGGGSRPVPCSWGTGCGRERFS